LCEFDVERKIFEGRNIFKSVTTSDEAFMLLIMRDCDKVPTKEDRKKTNWQEKDWRMQ